MTRGGYIIHAWGDPKFKCQSASWGKKFTWLLVALAAADGMLDPDDPIYQTWTGEGLLSHPRQYLNRGHHKQLTWRQILEQRGIWKGQRLVSADYLPNLQYGLGIRAFAGDPQSPVSFGKLNPANFPFGGPVLFPPHLIRQPVVAR